MTRPDDQGFEQVCDWISQHAGITVGVGKSDLLRQRMSRVLTQFGFDDMRRLARELEPIGASDLQLAVMDAASINHTYFYREPEVLQSFMDIALPTFQNRPEFRIWSAACSTGEEVYTIAVMLLETLGPEAARRMSILGTDISAPVVERAERGIYSETELARIDPQIVKRWCDPAGNSQLQVRPTLRNICTFRRMNLKATPYPFSRPFQAVFCRNVLYYFDRSDQAATLRAIYDMTEPGGWLVTSVTETIRDLETQWQPVAPGLYRRPS
jgi:chemotaxis protein methyltransferase CheR